MDFKNVALFDPAKGIENPTQPQKVSVDFDSEKPFSEVFDAFLNDPKVGEVRQLHIGQWFDEVAEVFNEVVDQLLENKDKLQGLETLFMADVDQDEAEISWIEQEDMGPVLVAFPNLKHFIVKGSNGLMFTDLKHDNLETLIIQTGGLGSETFDQVLQSSLPKLQVLEIWTGDSNYGADIEAVQVRPLLKGDLFPELRVLGLKNSEIADDIAKELADAPVLEQLHTLDVSMGIMKDEGAEYLLNSKLDHLKKLDVSSNYLSADMIQKIAQKWPNLELISGGQKSPDEYHGEVYYYVDVSE
ncbi:STM4015 family protein [Limibacter armeniacum]|uniref:STM4015 family protein n=1 Tax=Limibacter armeniacum TaxID=466084 RepID=UPI002FE6B116